MTKSKRAALRVEAEANAAYLVDMDAADVAFDTASVVYQVATAAYEVARIEHARAFNAAISTYDSAGAVLLTWCSRPCSLFARYCGWLRFSRSEPFADRSPFAHDPVRRLLDTVAGCNYSAGQYQPLLWVLCLDLRRFARVYPSRYPCVTADGGCALCWSRSSPLCL